MKVKKNTLLIIGAIPPPIGGVTIHVKRLLEHMDNVDINYSFVDLKKAGFFKTLSVITKNNIIHLHTSSVYARVLITVYCFFLRKLLIFTYHGNLNRFSVFKNFIDKISIKLDDIPILLN